MIHDSAQAQFVAQGNLLAEAERRESQLRTSIKETEHKVARLKDFEQRIEQHTAMQRLWWDRGMLYTTWSPLTNDHRDVDVQKYKEQTEAMRVLLSKYKKMELRLDGYERTHSMMEEQARWGYLMACMWCTYFTEKTSVYQGVTAADSNHGGEAQANPY
jgi:hypothetical protein